MNYGERTVERVFPVAGVRIDGCELVSIGLGKNKDGVTIDNLCKIEIKQPNGCIVSKAIFEPQPSTEQITKTKKDGTTYEEGNNAWQLKQLNDSMKHVSTKFITEEEYYAAIESNGGVKSFQDFVARVSNAVMPASKEVKFAAKFTYDNKGYVQVAKYIPFMAKIGDESTLVARLNDKFTPDAPSNPEASAPASAEF
jgi:hypothetical protein